MTSGSRAVGTPNPRLKEALTKPASYIDGRRNRAPMNNGLPGFPGSATAYIVENTEARDGVQAFEVPSNEKNLHKGRTKGRTQEAIVAASASPSRVEGPASI